MQVLNASSDTDSTLPSGQAPVNILLAVPNIGMQLSAVAARRLRAKRMSHFLDSRQVLLDTAVGREIEWLVMTELLELPYRQGDRICHRDALAEAILASSHLETVLIVCFHSKIAVTHEAGSEIVDPE
jgi:hypothetical protein